MKIKTKTLTDFLKKVKMEKSQQIDECILKFEEDGLKINANSASKQTRIMGWLKKAAFLEYEKIDNVGVNDLGTIIKVLERFGEKVTLTKEGNLLTVKGDSKKVDIELVAENFLETDTGEPALEFDNTFTIANGTLQSVFKDVQMNKDAIIKVTTEDKKVKFSNTGKYKFVNTMEALTVKEGTNVSFGEPLIDALANFDGVLEFSVKTDFPAKVRENLETSVVSVIVAPRVESE